jgi:uncharacterized SAM-dependent methyltransferase
MKIIKPSREFYTTYSKAQIDDIIFQLHTHHEIPMQYDYMGKGGKLWADYSSYLEGQDSESNSLNAAINLLSASSDYLNNFCSQVPRLAIVDLGVGTGSAVKGLLDYFIQQRSTIDYFGIDISQPLLDLTRDNLRTWLGENVQFNGHCLDFTTQQFRHLFANSPVSKTCNIVLLLGGTLNNFRAPDKVLQHIHSNLNPNDLLLIVTKLDTLATRQHFDFSLDNRPGQLSPDNQRMLDILGLDSSLYTPELGYDPVQQCRYIKVKINSDLELHFEHRDASYALRLNANERLLLWRAWHQTQVAFTESLQRNGFAAKAIFQSDDKVYSLTIAQKAKYS